MKNSTQILVSGRYKLGAVLGEGGMGKVYAAVDTKLSRDVAIKYMKPEVMDEEGAIDGFMYECQLLGRLQHPGILPVTDSGVDDKGVPYCVMKVIKGQTLGELIFEHKKFSGQKRKDSLANLLTVYSKLCETLSFIHHKRYIHRDIKPDNIMVDEFGVVLLVDWGLARAMSTGDDRPDASKTSTGLIKGTPLYMSPEQVVSSSKVLDGRSDLFALGVILYEIVVGKTPFESNDAYAILAKIKKGKYTSPEKARSDVPPPLASIINKALMLDAEKRYKGTTELGADINAFLQGATVQAHKASLYEKLNIFLRQKPAIAGGIFTLFIMAFITIGFNQYHRYLKHNKLQVRYRDLKDISEHLSQSHIKVKTEHKRLQILNEASSGRDSGSKVSQELKYRKSLAKRSLTAIVLRRNIMELLKEEKKFFDNKINKEELQTLNVAKEVSIEHLDEMLHDDHFFRAHLFAAVYLTKEVQEVFLFSSKEQKKIEEVRERAFGKLQDECKQRYGQKYEDFNWDEELYVFIKQFGLNNR